MTAYSLPTGDDDPIHLVRTVGRLAQMILELRDEYVDGRREDTLDQIERRLDEMTELHRRLRQLRESQDTALP